MLIMLDLHSLIHGCTVMIFLSGLDDVSAIEASGRVFAPIRFYWWFLMVIRGRIWGFIPLDLGVSGERPNWVGGYCFGDYSIVRGMTTTSGLLLNKQETLSDHLRHGGTHILNRTPSTPSDSCLTRPTQTLIISVISKNEMYESLLTCVRRVV
jgi:hypothetical protein